MKHISLKDQHESVKRFFESLDAEPAGAVVEVNGSRVYIIVRPAVPRVTNEESWSDAKNHRRAELVDREIAGTLTAAESIELADLQQQMIAYVDRVAPLPIEDVRELHRQLLEKARRPTTSSDQSA